MLLLFAVNGKWQQFTITLSSAKKYTDDLLIKIFQNGYIQWPGMPTPDTLFTFEGYRWAEVNYNGCFFRAKGSNALSFNGGEQGDAMRNIKGDIARTMSYDVSPSWPFYQQSASSDLVTSLTVAYFGAYQMLSFDAGLVVPTAEENRPRNRTFIIWRLEKI